MELRVLGPGDDRAVVEAAALFDDPLIAAATARFLDDPLHHLIVAYEEGTPAGFVSGVEMTHPDKGTEMLLYELGVLEGYRRRGIGKALVAALRDLAMERGGYGMWVLTDADNAAGLATYAAAGGANPQPQLMLEWLFE